MQYIVTDFQDTFPYHISGFVLHVTDVLEPAVQVMTFFASCCFRKKNNTHNKVVIIRPFEAADV